jgi:hypothetical protein
MKKSCLVILLTGLFLIGFVNAFAGGAGTLTNPYQINNCTHLQNMRNHLSSHFILINDIDCSMTLTWNSGQGFVPIGSFSGTLDGRNYQVSSLYINRNANNQAFVNTLNPSGYISNLNMVNLDIFGQKYVGGIVAENNGKVVDSYTSGNIYGSELAGGIAGINHGSIINSQSSSNVEINTGGYRAGGISGENKGIISGAYAMGHITGGVYLGGIAGYNDNGVIYNSYFNGNIIGKADPFVINAFLGGIVGYSYKGSILNCYNKGNVSGERSVGGIVGYLDRGVVNRTYSMGRISGSNNIGGLIGERNSGSVISSYWDTQTSTRATSAGGTGKTTSQMKQQATFAGWDFTNIWKIEEDISYPCFLWGSDCAVVIPPTIPPAPPIIPPSSCAPEDIILKLSDSTNAHGAIWSANYDVEVCYSDLFGSLYSGTNPRTCESADANIVLRLSGNSNAHAEVSTLANYNTKICYGDLRCTARDSCEADEVLVVSLSSNTNAHLSIGNNYPTKICCKKSSSYNANWKNMNNEIIATANVDDLVKMVMDGPYLSGKEVNFSIEKEVSSWVFFKSWKSQVKLTSNEGFALWRAEAGKYRFKAKLLDGSETEITSEILVVSSPAINSPPKVRIVSPLFDSKYKKGIPVLFEAVFEDEDDDLRAVWHFGDGNTQTKDNCMTEDCSVVHVYITQGVFNVRIEVEEMNRANPQRVSNTTRVLTFHEGINLIPIIHKPEKNQLFSTGINFIEFNASTSYISNCTSLSSCSSIMPAGATCYDKTNTPGDLDNLKCFNYPKPLIGSYYDMHFQWTFSEGESITGSWDKNYSKVVEFTRLFLTPGYHEGKLKLGYEKL